MLSRSNVAWPTKATNIDLLRRSHALRINSFVSVWLRSSERVGRARRRCLYGAERRGGLGASCLPAARRRSWRRVEEKHRIMEEALAPAASAAEREQRRDIRQADPTRF
jgi:hypothetical protein